MKIELEPIAYVRTSRSDLSDDDWGSVASTIELSDAFAAESLCGMDDFSHVEVLFLFDQVARDAIVTGARHPRGNEAWPRVGIFAQRGKARPNRLGATICRIVKLDGRCLHVQGLDAIDGTPVLDLKPIMREFLPREPTRQPAWATELMRDYWDKQA